MKYPVLTVDTMSSLKRRLLMALASEGGHWYTKDGEPMYEVEKANGDGMRPTTLRDARKLGLCPSVTTVMKELAAPALTMWKIEQAVMASKTLRRRKNETDQQYVYRAYARAMAKVGEAAELGSQIHEAVERKQLGKEYDMKFHPHVVAATSVIDKISEEYNIDEEEWVPEKSFCKHGYGGKVDAHCPVFILDFKTKDFDKDWEPKVHDNHFMQLGAYRVGLDIPNAAGGILYISRTNPGLVRYLSVTDDQMSKGYAMFHGLMSVWKAKRGYYPNG